MKKSADFNVYWENVETVEGDERRYNVQLRQDVSHHTFILIDRSFKDDRSAREFFTSMIRKHVSPRSTRYDVQARTQKNRSNT